MARQSNGLGVRDSNILTVRVPTENFIEFRKICNITGVQPSELIRNLMGEYIERNLKEDTKVIA